MKKKIKINRKKEISEEKINKIQNKSQKRSKNDFEK